ncbi:hypothetical protein WICMUC_002575 [Wickerhamomyces mucosus]|uniref:Pre-mRNA-splicing factor CWC21 n=1 Tax=Wickerhamomyces mucosus TaxID=1378264 RepID=A0A9P8PNT5_9ASCO|nr:hypothetical protein WICMUC_002575 [Wickerhamomyces mucosus]
MSYNGIGLSTARGSGTNGYIQKNVTHKNSLTSYQKRQSQKKLDSKLKTSNVTLDSIKDQELEIHNRKREIELKISEFRDKLEENDDLSDTEIEEKVEDFRNRIKSQYKSRHQRQEEKKKDTDGKHLKAGNRKFSKVEHLEIDY